MIDKAASRKSDGQAIERGERNKLLVRVGIAVVLIVGLIGALALFEGTQKVAEPEVPGVSSSVAPPVKPAPGGTNQASGPIQTPQEADTRVEPRAEPERTAAPEVAKPALPDRVEPAPEDSHPRLVVGRGGEPSSPHRVSQSVASGRAGALEQASKEHVAESPAKPMKAEVPSPAKPPNGFVLQIGVFSNVANAEDLRKRLVDAGIPAHIEARVQVGPFASQAEAVAAQQKLRALGMEPGMLIAPKRP